MSQHPQRKPIILVVDDELQILRVLRTSLPLWGYDVRTAQGGPEALDEIAKEMPELIILDIGADDYVTKPFAMNELMARVRAVMRRAAASEGDSHVMNVGDLSIDLDERRVVVSGKEIKLTPKEFEVLKYLVSNTGKVITHRALLQAVWGSESSEQTEYVRVFINQLRRKIEPDPQHPKYILTEPWVGYRFVAGE